MSNSFCFSLLRDSRGLLWTGTLGGLNRYDGSHFTVFNARQDSNSFINNTIIDLCEDKQGNIWGATGSGIFCYQVQQHKFTNYVPPGYDYARAVNNIICDKKGNIWATGLWTILKLNKQKDSFEEIGPLTKVKDSLSFYSVRANGMIEDPSGNGIWMATRLGLHYYTIAENKFTSYKNSGADSLFVKHSISALSWSKFGYYWFFDNTTREMVAFDPATHKILHRIPADGIIPGAVGQTLFEDSHHRLWFSTWNYKMAVVDYLNNRHTIIEYKNDNPLTVPGDNFWDVWEDEDNTIWLASGGGLARCNYTKSIFTIYPVADKVPEFSAGNIGEFAIDPINHSWWIASDANPSVINYNPETATYVLYDFTKAVKNSNGELPSTVYGFGFAGSQAFVFTGTGIWKMDAAKKQLTPFAKQFTRLTDQLPYYFANDGDLFWLSTRAGIIKWNSRTDESKLIAAFRPQLPDSQRVNYGVLYLDQHKKPWFIPAFGWLGNVNEKDEITLQYYVKDKPKELASYITNLGFDQKGNIWMSSLAAGMYHYNIRSGEMKLFDRIEGVGTDAGNFTIDKEGRLWIPAFSAFYSYDPLTGNASKYPLSLFEYTKNFAININTAPDSAVIAGFHRYIVKLSPGRIFSKPVLKAPLLGTVKIAGHIRLINGEDHLKLEPDENSLEFSFGSLILKDVFPYVFEYKLDGFDKDWIKAGTSDMAQYNNLQPGTYTFRVKAVSRNKNWETPERILKITIRTPFYKARWFWLLIAGLLITTLVIFYRFRLNKQKQILTLETKAQELEKEKTMVMYDSLKQQLNPHFLFNSLTSLSGLIDTNQQMAGEFLGQMSGIYRYILKNSENETVLLKDEIAFVQLYISLQQTRFKKGLQVNIQVPDEYLHYKIAPVTLQNLVENAIKHNIIDAGTPLVVDIFAEGEYLVVKNNLQKKSMVETSNKKGLAQIVSLYQYLSDLPVVISETDKSFIIKIPLI